MKKLTTIRLGLGMRVKDVDNKRTLSNAPCWVELRFHRLIDLLIKQSMQPLIIFPQNLRNFSIFGGTPEGTITAEDIDEAIEFILKSL